MSAEMSQRVRTDTEPLDQFFSSTDIDEARSRLENLKDWPSAEADIEYCATRIAESVRLPLSWAIPASFWVLAADIFRRADMHADCRKALSRGLHGIESDLSPEETSVGFRTLGLLEASENNWREAVTAWEDSLRYIIYDDAAEMALRKSLAEGYEALGVVERAELHYQEALKLAAGSGAGQAECELLCELGHHYAALDFDDQATFYFLEAKERARDEGFRSGEAAAEVGYGTLCLESGDRPAAERAISSALDIARELEDPLMQVTCLERIAEIQRAAGDFDDAQASLERAVFLAKGGGSAAALAGLYHMLAMLHEERGRTSLALTTYEKALSERRRAGDQAGVGATLTNLGALYHRMGNTDTAKEFYREALLAFNVSGRDRRELAIVLENLRRLEPDSDPSIKSYAPVEERHGLDRRHRPN